MPELCGFAEPFHRLSVILLYAQPTQVHEPQIVLGRRDALVAVAVQINRTFIIGRHVIQQRLHEDAGAFLICQLSPFEFPSCHPAEPFGRLRVVLGDTVAPEEHQSHKVQCLCGNILRLIDIDPLAELVLSIHGWASPCCLRFGQYMPYYSQ